jgi:cytochrome oxidase Cu insertion factor (SCO1/SenC/PrrC family)
MSDPSKRRSRIGLITLAVLFLGPMFAAFFAYQSGWQPGGQTAHGQLLSPARPLPELALSSLGEAALPDALLRREWTMLYIGDADCAESCQQTLYTMRQVWKSLGRRSKRVKGLYLLADQSDTTALQAFMLAEHKGMTLARSQQADQAEWLDFFSLDNSIQPLQADNIYIIDPLGNWVLVYRPEDPPKGLLSDLKKLLRLSQIG